MEMGDPDPDPRIVLIITRFNDNVVGIVQAADQLHEIFLAQGLMYTKQIAPELVVGDLDNRGGSLGSCDEVPALVIPSS